MCGTRRGAENAGYLEGEFLSADSRGFAQIFFLWKA